MDELNVARQRTRQSDEGEEAVPADIKTCYKDIMICTIRHRN